MKKAFLLFALPLTLFSISFGQTSPPFLTEINTDPNSLTEGQKSMVDKIDKNKIYKDVRLVQVNPLPNLVQPGGEFSFTIPGRKGEIIATPTHVNSQSPEDYEWYGTVKDGLG